MSGAVSSQDFAPQVLLRNLLPTEARNWTGHSAATFLRDVWDFFQAAKAMPAILQRGVQDKAPQQSKGGKAFEGRRVKTNLKRLWHKNRTLIL